jgi:hypothetical protein
MWQFDPLPHGDIKLWLALIFQKAFELFGYSPVQSCCGGTGMTTAGVEIAGMSLGAVEDIRLHWFKRRFWTL